MMQPAGGSETPSWPLSPRPQHQAEPSLVRPQLWAPPATTDVSVTSAAVTVPLPLLPLAVAVMVALPSAIAVITPLPFTATIVGALDAQVTPLVMCEPPWSLATRAQVPPTTMAAAGGETATAVIPLLLGPVVPPHATPSVATPMTQLRKILLT